MTAAELAANDEPLKALAIATDPAEVAALQHRVAHLESADAYAAFYNEPAPERPWMPLQYVADCHQTMPRWGLIWQQIQMHDHRSILELGCMDGFCVLNLAMGGRMAVGVDVSRDAIAEAERRARHFACPATFHCGMIEDVQLGAMFDAVLLLEVLEHVRDVPTVLAVAESHLAPGGRVYVSAPLTAPRHVHEREAREHVRLIDYDMMWRILRLGSEIRHSDSMDEVGMLHRKRPVFYSQLHTPDGLHHVGAYALD